MGKEPLLGRLRAKAVIDWSTGCHVWSKPLNTYGYGAIWVDGANRMAHRVAYELSEGPIPEGLVIDHLCRNRACVNPAHMEPVTNHENVMRGEGEAAKNKAKTHCPQGHEYSEDNTYRAARGDRQCKTCRRERDQQRSK
jgi:hypothetical protein